MDKLLRNLLKSKFIKVICLSVTVVSIVVILLYARAFYGSMRAFHQGETYLNEQQYIRAITFFDRSIHWYTPFNPYIEKSAQCLWEIGINAERKKDTRLALIAYRTIRRGFYAGNSFYTPGKSWIGKCNLKIHELIQLEQGEESPQGSQIKDKKISHKKQKVPIPNVYWTIILEIGFLGWIGSVIGFIVLGMGRKRDTANLIYSKLLWAAFAIVFFVLWLVGMVKA
jgi:hypothetical protein